MTRGVPYSVPLREDFTAQLVLPYDLTEEEAVRLCAMLHTLVLPVVATPMETP